MKERLASLISGGGTTMEAIVKACQSGEVDMEVACIISSNPEAGGIEKAKRLGIPVSEIVIVNPKDFKGEDGRTNQEAFGAKLVEELESRGVSVVTQNGWMPLTPVGVIQAFEGKIFNQHPGPVPEFGGKGMYGRRVHAAVLYFRRKIGREQEMWTEVIAQQVHREYDRGKVVGLARVEILPTDTVEDLQARALPMEHEVQIELLKDVVAGRVEEVSKRESLVKPGEEQILEESKEAAGLLYPRG